MPAPLDMLARRIPCSQGVSAATWVPLGVMEPATATSGQKVERARVGPPLAARDEEQGSVVQAPAGKRLTLHSHGHTARIRPICEGREHHGAARRRAPRARIPWIPRQASLSAARAGCAPGSSSRSPEARHVYPHRARRNGCQVAAAPAAQPGRVLGLTRAGVWVLFLLAAANGLFL
jgi:hypothetical protein